MSPQRVLLLGVFSMFSLIPAAFAAEDTVATAVYSKIGNGYKREKAKDGSFKPEYYALSNGGRIAGTITDSTVDRVTYPEVADIAMKLLAQQSYRYAQSKEQAQLLLVLNWGGTIGVNSIQKDMNVASQQKALQNLQTLAEVARQGAAPTYAGEDVVKNTINGFGPTVQTKGATNEIMAVQAAAGSVESGYLRSLVDDRVRDRLNEFNSQVLGYRDELADANGIQRYAGAGDHFNDLLMDVEESRYYIIVSAYDFRELLKTQKRKLLWQTRVSVRSPGNSFNDTYLAMLKSASKYFGQDSRRLVRGEETKGTVELGELKFLGEAKNAPAKAAEPAKAGEKKK